MDAVAEVPGGVGHVHGRRVDEVLLGAAVVAGVGGRDGLDALRERRVTGGERVVVGEDAPPLLAREPSGSMTVASTTSACLMTWWR